MTWLLKPKVPFREIRDNHDEMFVYKVTAPNHKPTNYNSAMFDPNVRAAKKWANTSCQGAWAFSNIADNDMSSADLLSKATHFVYLVLTDSEDAMMWELQNHERVKMLMIPSNMPFFYKYH